MKRFSACISPVATPVGSKEPWRLCCAAGRCRKIIGRLRDDFETWRTRDLVDEDMRYVFMDGWYPKVRIGGRRERVPVLVTLGVRATGERVVLDMRLVGDESAASWTDVVASLAARHLARPVLAVIDGNPGLTNALRSHWPGIAIQRCTVHKLRNLQAKAPARLRDELTEDYRRMIYGETVAAVEQARARFTKNGGCAVPRSSRVWRRRATSSSPFCAFLRRHGVRCGPRPPTASGARAGGRSKEHEAR
jgi:transposase-like protein